MIEYMSVCAKLLKRFEKAQNARNSSQKQRIVLKKQQKFSQEWHEEE